MSVFKMAGNVFGLGEVGDLEPQMFGLTTKFNKMQKATINHENPAIGNVLLPAVILVKTRDEAQEQMKLGNSFKATTWRSVTNFNKRILRFYLSKYNYKKSKSDRGLDLYEPVL